MKKPKRPIISNSNTSKPATIYGYQKKYIDNVHQQTLLLKAISGGVTDVKDLARLSGMRNATEVWRSLDRLSIRKKYHEALARSGIDLSYLVDKIKDLCENASSDNTRLKAVQVLLKSVGLDNYEDAESTGKNWEEALLSVQPAEGSGSHSLIESVKNNEDYDVKIPEVPETVKIKQENEKKIAEELYGE